MGNSELEKLLTRLHNAQIARDRAVGDWGKDYWEKVVTYLESHLAAVKFLEMRNITV